MFDAAETGVVAWPTTFPDLENYDDKGNPLEVRVPVRYRVLVRDDIRGLDEAAPRRVHAELRKALMEGVANISQARDDAAIVKAMEAVDATLIAALGKNGEVDRERMERVTARTLEWKPDPDKPWEKLAPERLAKLCAVEPYFLSFERGLIEASKGARAKN